MLFRPKLLVELLLELHFFLVKLSVQVCKTFIDVFELLLFQPGKFVSRLVQQFAVLLVESACVEDHLLEIQHVLLQTSCHVFNLDELMAIMFIKDAASANCVATCLAKVLNPFVNVPDTAREVAVLAK